jgi:cytochrome b
LTTHPSTYVWDPVVRLFHWLLVLSFVVAFVTEDDLLAVHVWAGYAVAGLVLTRALWGFVGTAHARWSDFVRPPRAVARYLAAAARHRAPRYLGHNPAGGAMILALLVCLVATVVSGLALYGGQELSGPLAGFMSGVPVAWAHGLEEVHEVLANLTLALVALHLVGVAAASLQHRENLVKAMFTGYKRTGLR